jgi:hypothetical protein
MALRVSQHALDVQRAGAEIETTILKMAEEKGFTALELLQRLTSLQQGIVKDLLQAERRAGDDNTT